ncbi:MAG: propanoyl-CoA acyltransferase [Deltaproteobacteria bacterium HGW-Deltaproteobacteria-19]|jgi:acetyl-CoA C-acetyltransferase|nr:MAG: propanoyl-CoA acyltransferase [Deltaproteobacteria bacterium HGW-Deltaproteobacteria-19]
MAKRVAIVGTGQTFHKSHRPDVNGQELINEAVQRALVDANLKMKDISAILIGNMDHFEGINYVDCWSVDGSGGVMKPVIKLTTGGTTGASLAIGGYHMVASGMFEKVLIIGWEKNSESDTTGAITTAFDPIWDRQVFAGAISGLAAEAQGYMARFGACDRDAARVSVRDRKHATNNPHAQLRKEVTLEEVLASPMLADPIHLLDVCPRTDGACAVIMANEDVAGKICSVPDWIWATAARHSYTYLGDGDWGRLTSMEKCSKEIWKKTGIKEPRKEIDVIEMYQPYSFAGLIWIEDMGIVGHGEAPQYIWDGNTDMGGELPVNPSGGVIACNPIGATGLIRCAEAAMQVMGKADARQVPDVNFAVSTGFGGCMWTDMLLHGKKKPN